MENKTCNESDSSGSASAGSAGGPPAGSKNSSATSSTILSSALSGRCLQGPAFALWFYAGLILYWFRHYLISYVAGKWVPAVDLAGHVAAIKALMSQLPWRVTFYDHQSFTGWPAFQFYAFLSHLAAAFVAIVISPFCSNPALLSAYLILLFSAAALPAAMYYCGRPLIDELCAASDFSERHLARIRLLLAYSCGAFSFWFLNHDGQWHGVGAASSMNIGLLSHGTGLVLLLVNLGALFRLIISDRHSSKKVGTVALTFAALFLTHSLSALVALAAGTFSIVWYVNRRKQVAVGYLLGLGLTGFWLLPHQAFAGGFITLDIIKPDGDFFKLFFKYPAWWLLRGLFDLRHIAGLKIDPTNLVTVIVLIYMLLDQRIRSSRLFIPFLCFVVAFLFVTSSAFVAQSIPLGLHYYRFPGYAFLLLTTLIAAAAVVPVLNSPDSGRKGTWLMVISLLICSSQILLPHYERDRIIEETGTETRKDEERVFEIMRRRPEKGRVYVQYFNDYKRYPWLDAHYLHTRLKDETGFDPVNGLFIQSSLAYLFPSGSAAALGLMTFSSPLFFLEGSTVDDKQRAEQLRQFGITDLIVGEDKVDRLRPHAIGPIESVGPYAIVPIASHHRSLLEPARGDSPQTFLIGYRDLSGGLPFMMIEFYFYNRADLFDRFRLIDLTGLKEIPQGLDAVMVNSISPNLADESSLQFAGSTPIIRLRYRPSFPINHYSVRYQDNFQLDDFQEAAKWLDQNRGLRKSLFALRPTASVQSTGHERFEWSADGQEVNFSGLQPGLPYLFNFSYFPYWQATGGAVYRGSPERIMIVPTGDSMTFQYSRLGFASTWLGWGITIVSSVLVYGMMRRRRA